MLTMIARPRWHRCQWSGNEDVRVAELKSFQETYIFPKKGEDGLLSAQPDSRSSEPPL